MLVDFRVSISFEVTSVVFTAGHVYQMYLCSNKNMDFHLQFFPL